MKPGKLGPFCSPFPGLFPWSRYANHYTLDNATKLHTNLESRTVLNYILTPLFPWWGSKFEFPGFVSIYLILTIFALF